MRKIYEFIDVNPNVESEAVEKIQGYHPENKFGLACMRIYHEHIEQRNLPYPIKKTMLNIANLRGHRSPSHRFHPSNTR